MKPSPIHITIPTPCSQRWDKMSNVNSGRHCDSCNQTVIDFTTWSDSALHNFLFRNAGHFCGRLLTTQLNRPIQIPYQPHSRLYRLAIATGLMLMFTQAPSIYAQGKPPMVNKNTLVPTNDTVMKKTDSVQTSIRGVVTDTKKEPLVIASVKVTQGGIIKGGAVTDYDGNYFVSNLAPGEYDVEVAYIGYKNSRITKILVRKKRNNNA